MLKSLPKILVIITIIVTSCSYVMSADILEGKLKVADLSDGSKYYYIEYSNNQTKYFNDLNNFLNDSQIILPYHLHMANDNNPYGFHTTVTQDNFKPWADIDRYIAFNITYRFRVVDGIHIFSNKAQDGTTTVWFVEWLEPYGNTQKYFTNIFNENGSELHASVGYYKF